MNKKAFAYPYVVWMGIFIIVPMAMVVICAFTADFNSGDFTFTLANFERLINSELNYVADRKSTRLNSSHNVASRMPSSA